MHMGGDVSAPVFSRMVGGALRLLAVAPDEPVARPRSCRRARRQSVRTAALR